MKEKVCFACNQFFPIKDMKYFDCDCDIPLFAICKQCYEKRLVKRGNLMILDCDDSLFIFSAKYNFEQLNIEHIENEYLKKQLVEEIFKLDRNFVVESVRNNTFGKFLSRQKRFI